MTGLHPFTFAAAGTQTLVPSADSTIAGTIRAAELERTGRMFQANWSPPSASCRRCHRSLHAAKSIAAGIGPACARKEAATGQLSIEEAVA